MRLLSSPQGKSRLQQENANQELRSLELDGLIRNKRKELNDLDQAVIRSLSELGTRNYEEEQLWKAKLASLTEEVEQLEERKKRALLPLESKEKELQDRDSALLKREETATIKESDLEYTKDALEKRLDEVSEREQEATDYSTILNNREFAIKLQEGQIRERSTALVEILKESLAEMEVAKAEIARRKAIQKGKEVPLAERERLVAEQEASFANRERAILDRYRTLQRAITETNLKGRA